MLGTSTRLGESLVAEGLLSNDELGVALAEQRNGSERLGRCLERLGLMTRSQILPILARQRGLEYLSPDAIECAPEAVNAVPQEFARAHGVLPLGLDAHSIRIATADPGNEAVTEDLRLLTGREVIEVVTDEESLADRIVDSYQITVERMVEDLHSGFAAAAVSDNLHDLEVMASEPTVINLVNLIISSAIRDRASDVHLVPFESCIELRYRIDGVLAEIPPPPRNLHAALVSRIKIMAEMNIAERFIPQDGRIQIQHSGVRVDIRVGTMPTVHGESVVMRLLEKSAGIQTIQALGLDEVRAERLLYTVSKPHGIFLATGPTGSGKTTSLYSILSSIYTIEKKILTIEDPVEYDLPGVAQIPVRPSRGFTFATGLRAILRQDPDVVMVGEIRDVETAEIAVRAALTGHLVFSTLHTNDAAGAVTRLIDMGIEPFLIASSLEGVLAQRLVRRICENCKAPVEVPEDTRVKARLQGVDVTGTQYYAGQGCGECRDTGYRGRLGLFELLVFDSRVRELVMARASSGEIKQAVADEMVSVRTDGFDKAAAGRTTLDEVLRVAFEQS